MFALRLAALSSILRSTINLIKCFKLVRRRPPALMTSNWQRPSSRTLLFWTRSPMQLPEVIPLPESRPLRFRYARASVEPLSAKSGFASGSKLMIGSQATASGLLPSESRFHQLIFCTWSTQGQTIREVSRPFSGLSIAKKGCCST